MLTMTAVSQKKVCLLMHLSTAAYRRKKLSLTSLIDVIFLLLLFFMLSSTFSKFGKVDINPASSTGSSQQNKPSIIISLSSKNIRINGQNVDITLINDHLSQLVENEKSTALVRIVKGASTQKLADLLQALSLIKGLKISLVK